MIISPFVVQYRTHVNFCLLFFSLRLQVYLLVLQGCDHEKPESVLGHREQAALVEQAMAELKQRPPGPVKRRKRTSTPSDPRATRATIAPLAAVTNLQSVNTQNWARCNEMRQNISRRNATFYPATLGILLGLVLHHRNTCHQAASGGTGSSPQYTERTGEELATPLPAGI